MTSEITNVNCILDDINVSFQFEIGQSSKEIIKILHSLRPGSENKIPKLYDNNGSLIPVNSKILARKADECYKLAFTDAISVSAILKTDVKTPIKDLEIINKKINQLKEFSFNASTNRKLVVKPAVIKVQKLVEKAQFRFEKTPKVFPESVYDSLKSSTFDVWNYNDDDMSHFLIHMMNSLGIVKHFTISENVLASFIFALRQSYNPNPFHNYKHAFCVTQMLYALLHISGLIEKLSMVEKLSIMIGAMAHDLDHPGYNNAYQMNALTDLAITYNDASPLENHHSAILFAILRVPEMNILSSLTAQEYKDVRKLVITCILATDMGRHAELISRLREIVSQFSLEDPNHRILLFQLLFKTADISNEARPTNVSEPWVDLLLQEFFNQSDLEKEKGLPFAPFMDRDKVTKPSAQVGFIGFVLLPLMEEVSKVLPELRPIVRTIQAAKEYYLASIN